MKGDAGTYFDPELLTVFLEHVVPRAFVQDAVSGEAADPPAALPPAARLQKEEPVP